MSCVCVSDRERNVSACACKHMRACVRDVDGEGDRDGTMKL